MIEQLKTFETNIIAVEIINGFTPMDEKMIEKLFEKKLKKFDKINLVIQMDKAKLSESSMRAFFKDVDFVGRNILTLNKIAVVGDSTLLKILVPVDNFFYQIFNSEGQEKYFNTHDLEEAYSFVNKK